MFFLVRSACCIGLVVAALPAPGGSSGPHATPASAASAALAQAEHLCRAAPERCAALLGRAVQSPSADLFRALAIRRRETPSSRDTLTVADREPAWLEPGRPAAD